MDIKSETVCKNMRATSWSKFYILRQLMTIDKKPDF